MQISTKTPPTFSPHPGTIVYHYKWNGKDELMKAANIPDSVKFIYYDASGHETSDVNTATQRVPVLETEIISMDKDGHLVAPEKASSFEMTDFGPEHRYLRHTTGSAPAR